MLTDRHFPYSSMQEINLDWILTKVKNILRFVPDDGAVGQILRRTAHGAEWSNEQGGGGAVTSVNGQTGDVILSIPTDTSDLNNDSGFVDAAGAAAAAPVQSVNSQTGTVVLTKSDVGLGSVDNVQQYSASNPPPYPVTSVNTQTGDVVLSIPTDISDLNNDSGFVDAAGAAAAAPVQSVNGQTGAVVTDNVTVLDNSLRANEMTFPSVFSLYRDNTITKMGKLCIVSFGISIASVPSISQYSITNYLPTGYRPMTKTSGFGETGLGDGKYQPVIFETDGSLTIFPMNTGRQTYAIGSAIMISNN